MTKKSTHGPTRLTLTALLFACLLLSPGAFGQDEEKNELLFPMFLGNTLTGWHKLGGAEWKFVGKTLVAETTAGEGYIVTDKVYGDFIMEAEVNIPEGANSGIVFRAVEDKDAGTLTGYQVEIDSTARRASGGVYDAERGFVGPIEGDAKDAFRDGLWNHIRIEAIGAHIRTFVNKKPVVDIYDPQRMSGHVALQHDGGRGKKYRFRNVTFWKLPPHRWKPLFNGKDLTGWEELPGGSWKVNDGVIIGLSDKSEKRHGMLLSKAEYTDFTVRVVYKAIKGNSGFYFRCKPADGNVSVKGFQAEIDPNKDAGGLYETGGRGWVVKPSKDDVKKWYKPGEWNEMTVSAFEGRVVVHVNGHKTAELTNDPGYMVGHFGLQLHGGQDMHVEFKSIEILTRNP